MFAEGDLSALSLMAYLTQILTIWEKVSLNILQLAHTRLDSYVRLIEEFRTDIIRWTDDWSQELPERFKFSAANL